MEARQIRRRHFFHSSVGSLLNEHYNSALTPRSAKTSPRSAKTSPRPLSRNHCNSLEGRTQYIDKLGDKLPISDLHEGNNNVHFGSNALSQKSNTNKECISYSSSRSPSAVSVSSSGSCLSLPRKLSADRSTASSQLTTSGPLTWPEYNGQGSRQSTPSGSETSTYRPFSSTTNDFVGGKFRFTPVTTPHSVDHSAKLEPPQYYDAYREIMDTKAKTPSIVCSVTQGDANIETLSKLEFPCNPRVKQSVPNVCKLASSSHSSGNTHRVISDRPGTSASSNVSVNQQKCVTSYFINDQRKSRGRSSTAISWPESQRNEQKPNVLYAGRTPSRTPSPDYMLPVFQSHAWIQHYSPTYIRHFMRAANTAIKN